MSKLHLPNNFSSIFNPLVYTPDDETFVPENWFLKAIAKVTKSMTPTPNPSRFKFSAGTASVDFNIQLLKDLGNDFASILVHNQDISLSYNSEFWSLAALSSMYKHHNKFPFFSSVHQQDMHYETTRLLSNKERMAELNANMARENHRLAIKRPDILEEKLNRDVNLGFLFWYGHLHYVTSQAPPTRAGKHEV